MTDKEFLIKAIEVGNQIPAPYNFGAIVVMNNEIVSAEHNHVHEQNNPSLHSEISAIVAACKKLETNNLEGATLYCSHEPCTMCFSCASWAKINRIVFATSASDQENFMYEFKDLNIFELSKKLVRPMKIEHLQI